MGQTDLQPSISSPLERSKMNQEVQTDPASASTKDIKAEIRYLRRLEKKYGSHTLRLLAITALNAELLKRGEGYA